MRTKPSTFTRCILLLSFLFIGKFASAQDPINVTINLIPPYPNFAYEVINMGDQGIITLQNTDFNNSYSIKLGIELSGGNGIIVRSKENALPNQAINLGPGESLVLSSEELSDFYNNYSESDFDFIGISVQDVLNDQQLPDGSYTICLRAYEYTTNFPLSSSSPAGCSFPFSVIAVDPPIISYPLNETTVDIIDPQLLNINWIPASITIPDLRYRIEIVDLTDMQMNPYDAFLTGDFLFFWEEDIVSNTFFYGMEYPLLLEGHEYAIRIATYRTDGLLNIKNDGFSDIVTFRYGELPQVEVATLPEAFLNCGAACYFPLSGNEVSGSNSPAVHDILDFGNFQMSVSTISGNNTYSGTGIIQSTTYIPVGIKVEFENLKVSGDGRVFEGQAKAIIRENSWLDETWSDIQTYADDININNYSQLYAESKNIDHHIDNLPKEVGTSLPITIGDVNNSLEIVGINFFPDRASFNLSYIQQLADDPTGTRYLHFMTKDLCITPGGPSVGEDEARLELVKPLTYKFDNSTSLTFQPLSSQNEGTFLSFDCNGFVGVNAIGEVHFSPDVFVPVNNIGVVQHGDTLRAQFQFNYTEWSDWLATVSFDYIGTDQNDQSSSNLFIYKELEDYIFHVENAIIDHSINNAIPNISFPENYTTSTGAEWQGLYIESLKIDLPRWVKSKDSNSQRIQIIGSDLIVDSDGLTGLLESENLIVSENGSMGKWPFSIDSLSIEFLQNNLQKAYLKGELILPIVEEPFDYTADIQFLNGATDHTFTFSPLESYTFPAWYANVELAPESKLKVVIDNANSFVEANLHGNISFEPIIGDIDKMNLTDISFTDLIVRSAKKPTYIEFGGIQSAAADPTVLAAAGFGLILESLNWSEGTGGITGLLAGIELDLGGDLTSIKGATDMLIKNKILDLGETISIDYDGFSFNDISLDVETGAVDLKGKVSFFDNDEKFGNGFNGSLEVNFVKTVKLNGTVLFGNKVVNAEKVNYWYASAMAYMPTNPVPMATPLDVYGFGGGFYYNMAIDPNFKLSPGNGSNFDPKEVFSVDPGTLGFQASVLTALTPSSRTFNADVTLSVELSSNGGLNHVRLDGAGYVMQEIDATNKEEAMVTAEVAIEYDFQIKTFTAYLGMHGDIPKSSPILIVDGNIDLFVSPDKWYFRAGTPTDKLTTSLNIGFADDALTVGAYFMTGMELIAPVLPNEISSFFNFNSSLVENIQNSGGVGFLAGVHLDLDLDLSAFGTGVQIRAMAGVDIGLINYDLAICNGNTDFGINKWYAQGQGYIYGSFTLEVLSFDAFSIQAGVILEGAFPNPTGVKGKVKTTITVLGFDVDVSENFSLGTICTMEMMDGVEVERLELELENMDLIGVVNPVSGAPFVSTSIQPTVQWFKENGEMKGYIYGDGLGGIISKIYRFKNELSWELLDDNEEWTSVNYQESLNEEENISTLKAVNADGVPSLINGLTTFKLKARSYIEQYSGTIADYQNSQSSGTWGPANYLEGDKKGQQIQEIKENVFVTLSNLTEIDPTQVAYTLPVDRQRFYPYSYLSQGRVNFNVDNTLKFEEFEECGFEIKAEFQKIDDQDVQVLPTVRPEPLNLEFDMGSLSPETIYKIQIVAERQIHNLLTVMESDEDNTSCKIVDTESVEQSLEESFDISIDLGNFSDNTILQNAMSNGQNSTSLNPASGYILHRKILYTFYFRTSQFATPQDKMNAISVSSTEVVPSGEFHYVTIHNPIYEIPNSSNNTSSSSSSSSSSSFPQLNNTNNNTSVSQINYNSSVVPNNNISSQTSPQIIGWEDVIVQKSVEKALISLYCPEGFDRFDILGHSFENTPELREYFKFYGPDQQSTGLATDVQNWFQSIHANIGGYGNEFTDGDINAMQSAPSNLTQHAEEIDNQVSTIADEPWVVNYSPDPNNAANIKYLYPLLSDIEVGLSEPEVVISNTSSNSSSSSSSTSSSSSSTSFTSMLNFGNSNPQNFTPITSALPSLTQLELEYNVEVSAFEKRKYLVDLNSENIGPIGPHISPPAGVYPISILLANDANPGFPSNEIPSAKVISPNISFD